MDYKKIGLKVGIEIHQQLDTCKLFCSCPSELKKENADRKIQRKIRSAKGETGETDIAASYEEKRKMNYIYETYEDTNCLVETDSEPPHDLNREALKIAIQISKLLNAKIVDEFHVMRKTVIDGSNTSGFQRTGLISLDGEIKGTKIPSINLEEDSARRVSFQENKKTFRLDRLGIAEVEIGTDPSIDSPEKARDVAKRIGMVLRSCDVKRGLGTIRQDINVSVKGGNRVEIKLVQNLDDIPEIVEKEIERQQNLIEISKELKKRASKKDLKEDFVVLSSIFEKTESNVIKNQDGIVLGFKLPGFSGLVGKQINKNRRLGSEFADHVKLVGLKGLFHSDELPNYGITMDEVKQVRKALDCKENDAFVLIVGHPDKVSQAMKFVFQRAKQAFDGVPREVRELDGTTNKFMRPMPGASRLYPETDIPCIRLDKKYVDSIKKPETLEKKVKRLEKKLPEEIVSQLVRSKYLPVFEEITEKTKIDPVLIATTFTSTIKDLKRKGTSSEWKKDQLLRIFKELEKGKITKDSIQTILENGPESIERSLENFRTLSEKEVEKIVLDVLKENKGKSMGALMGIIMSKTKGKADGKTVSKILKKHFD